MSHLKSNDFISNLHWKLSICYTIDGLPIVIKNNLNQSEYKEIINYKSLKKCPHDTLIEQHCSHISYIENCLPFVCQSCGLIGHHLEMFSDKGFNPLYGTYYD